MNFRLSKSRMSFPADDSTLLVPLLTFGLWNNQKMGGGPLLSNHKCHSARLLGRCHGEDQQMLTALARHLVHFVSLERAGAEPPDPLGHVCVTQLTDKLGVLTCRHSDVLQRRNDPHALCGGRGGYEQLIV